MALQAANGCFVSIDPEDDAVVALRKTVGEAEICTIRTCAVREANSDDETPVEEKGSLAEVEINYVLVFLLVYFCIWCSSSIEQITGIKT